MFFFGYTKFLEEQNRLLQSRIESLESRNQELVVEILSKARFSVSTDPEKEISNHKMTKGEKKAMCSCGWVYVSDDPGKLQTAITSHYREVRVNRGRKSWQQVKSALEGASEES